MNSYRCVQQSHAHCMVCGSREHNSDSLGLVFTPQVDGSVSAPFVVNPKYQGYTGLLHGGMTSTLLDAAMTHCLFMQGIQALTAELTVRFMVPIHVGQRLLVCAKMLSQRRGLYQLEAWLVAGHRQVARASAKFITPSSGSLAHGD